MVAMNEKEKSRLAQTVAKGAAALEKTQTPVLAAIFENVLHDFESFLDDAESRETARSLLLQFLGQLILEREGE